MLPLGLICIKNKNTVPPCDLVSEPSGISAVTVTLICPNPIIKSECIVVCPSAGILAISPLLSFPRNIVPVFKEITGEKSAKLYTMRHTFGTYLYDLTKDMDTVGRKLGHKGLKNVDKYIHVAKDLREQSGKRNLFNQALRLIKAR